MTKYTPQQVRVLVHNAGFRGDDEVTMTAIVLAESGGDSNAVGTNTNGTKDYGLAQINSSHFGERLDNGIFGVGASSINLGNVLDPQINLEFADKLYKARGNTFKDWSTYNSGKYKQFLAQVTGSTVTPDVTGNIPQDIANQATDSVTGAVNSALSAAFSGFAPTITKVAFVGVAAAIVGAGLWKITAKQRAAGVATLAKLRP